MNKKQQQSIHNTYFNQCSQLPYYLHYYLEEMNLKSNFVNRNYVFSIEAMSNMNENGENLETNLKCCFI